MEAGEKPAIKEHALRAVSKVINRVVDEIRDTLLTLVLTVMSDSDCGLEPVSVAHSIVMLVSLSGRHQNLKGQLKLRI